MIVCHCCGEAPQQRPISTTRLAWRCACPDLPLHTRNQAKEIGDLLDLVKRKNLELDALHFVWCDGGCASGVHRFDRGELTQEIVDEAVRNTRRLEAWWKSRQAREVEKP